MTERNQSLQRELNLQRKSFKLSQDRSKDIIEGLISENSHLTKMLGLAEKERDDLSLEMKELQAQYEENIEKLDQVSQYTASCHTIPFLLSSMCVLVADLCAQVY